MASQSSNNLTNTSSDELSAAQKLMQKHAEEAHKASMEEVADEDDLKHGEAPKSASILEPADDDGLSIPTWAKPVSVKAAGKQKAQELPVQANRPTLDTQSHDLFPKLGGAPKPQNGPTVPSIWNAKKPTNGSPPGTNGKANGLTTNNSSRASTPTSGIATPTSTGNSATTRTFPAVMTMPGRHTERIHLSPAQMLSRPQMKKPLTDVLKDINKRSKATVTNTTVQGGSQWFTASGPADACRQALKDLVEQIGSKQTIKVSIPRSAKSHIIGKGGSTIKALQESCGARIQLPKNDDMGVDGNDDTMIEVVIEGNALSTATAQAEILKIAAEKASNLTYRMRDIPAEFYPFIAGPQNEKIHALQESKNVQIQIPDHHTATRQPLQATIPGQRSNFLPAAPDNLIIISGDRMAVQETRAEIERQAEELKRQLILEQFAINRGRHQFIVGERGIPVHEFLADTGCAIILPSEPDDETISIVGPADQVQAGVERAMDLATSMHSTNVDISRHHRNAPGGAAAHARNLTRYFQQRKEIERLEKLYNTHIVTPTQSEGAAPWELYSRDGKNAIRAQSEINSIINGHPPSRMANIDVDPIFHQHIKRDLSPVVRKSYGVHTIVPTESERNVPVLLVFEGPGGLEPGYQVPRAQPTPSDIEQFQRALEEASKYILEIISSQEEITTQSIEVPPRFYDKLKTYFVEEKAKAKHQVPVTATPKGNTIVLRGPLSAVETFAGNMNAFIAQEIEDDKERGFKLSFDFPQKHANQLIGRNGVHIEELRKKFNVDIKVGDGKIELTGPKAKAEAAKSHITTLGKQWADEATHTLKIEPKYHRELIGAGGAQINKLQTRYKVQIHFPRSARPVKDDQSVADGASESGTKGFRRSQADDEVIVRGPSKGADEARDEILSLLQYLKDNSYSATISVQQSQIPSLIGQGGKGMDELRQLTGAKIDVPGSRDARDPSGRVEIQIKGTKAQVAQAKKLIEDKKQVFDQTISRTLEVDKRHHSALIGGGGSKIREIVVNAGGPDNQREIARAVQFPRSATDGNLVKIEGDKDVVDKITAAINAIVAERETQIVETLDVPVDRHRSLIGRQGETRKELEKALNVSIEVPRQGDGRTGVTITGQPKDVAKAKEHIQELVKGEEGVTVQVPKNLHHSISENGQFFRKLKKDHQVNVDHAGHKVPPKPAALSGTRSNGGALPLITDDQDTSSEAYSWSVISLIDSSLDGEIPWILRGPPDNITKAKESLTSAIDQASQMTSAGYLVLPDPRTYRYVIGQGGSKVKSIRNQTGCKINVPRDQAKDEAIEITGSVDGVEKAKMLILQAVKEGMGNGSNGSRA